MRLRFVALILAAASLILPLFSGVLRAEEGGVQQRQPGTELDRRYVLGIAVGLERFDTNIRIVDRSTGNSIFVDGEGSFGLPQSNTIPIVYGGFRINEKHGIGFFSFRVNRSGTSLAVDRDYGRLLVNGRVSFEDTSSLSYLNYSYALFDDNQTYMRALFGVYMLDLRMRLDAIGEVTLDGQPIQSGEYSDTVKEFAPLPMIGIDYWSRITDNWFIGGKVAFMSGSYDDVTAKALDASIRARYRMTDRVSLITGLNFMSADVDIKRPSTKREIGYGFEGVYLGLDFNF